MNPRISHLAASLLLAVGTAAPTCAAASPDSAIHDSREVRLADVRQLTAGGENAEAYWSPSGDELVFQATREGFECDQIFRLRLDAPQEKILVSSGEGRTTCAYFTYPDGERILYSSTHLESTECPPRPDFSQGYVWPIYPSYEIFSVALDGSDRLQLTDNEAYDAEATVCPQDGSIVFTSTRDGDLDLYRMKADGSDVVRLTDAPGYDGGAFFSTDCERIVWRASRPREGAELDDYQRLLDQDLIRPGELEIWIANADGSEPRQITYLESGSFAPYFHPAGDKVLFSTNYGNENAREFDIWMVGIDGGGLERVTFAAGFDGFPMFSPDGEWLAFASNRNQGAPGETNVFVARWIEDAGGALADDPATASAGRFRAAVEWLAADEREGRGVGTAGLEAAAAFIEERFAELGVAGGGDSYSQAFEVPVNVEAKPGTALLVDGEEIDNNGWRVASFSATGAAAGEIVPVGYGITAPEHGLDDYAGREVEGRIALIRRFTAATAPFDDDDVRRRYSDLRYKAWNARQHGAVAALIVDLPLMSDGEELPEEAALPRLTVDAEGDAGLPVAILRREVAKDLFEGSHAVRLTVDLAIEHARARNVIGKIESDSERSGAILIGAHYDHLGFGGRGSRAPDSREPHNGADDNASGTAALLEIARQLVQRRTELERDIFLVAFSGEESGLLGSTYLVRQPPAGLEIESLVAMLNLDMVGRLRANRLSVLGAESAEEWSAIVPDACERAGLGCALGGDGYGPSDQTPFYAAGVPVLHFFTGTHDDYHKPSDDTHRINAIGGAKTAELVADLTLELSRRDASLTYKTVPAPPPQGDARSYGASLGTIPDYAGDGRPGVLLAGAREDSPAARAGLERGDLLVELAGHPIGDIYDFMFVLRQSKPGETVRAVVLRGDERMTVEVTFGENRQMR